MTKNVTSKILKSAGTDTPEPQAETPARGRKPVAPENRTLVIRGGKRRYWVTMLAALDGDRNAQSVLFGAAAPAEPVAPVLSDEDRTDPSAVLFHVDALNAYALAVRDYPAALESFHSENLARREIRSVVNAAILDIPLRKRNSDETDETEHSETDMDGLDS
jgi:hypothetical protein